MRREARHKRKFSLARILGDPFALATISIAIVSIKAASHVRGSIWLTQVLQLAWLIAFISAILSSINQYARNPFPNFAWWTVAYYLCCIIGVIVMVALDSVYNYHVAVRIPTPCLTLDDVLTVTGGCVSRLRALPFDLGSGQHHLRFKWTTSSRCFWVHIAFRRCCELPPICSYKELG